MQARRWAAAIALAGLTVWSLAGIALVRDVLEAREAVDVVAASQLCPPLCPPALPDPSWLVVGVLAGWAVLAAISAVTLVAVLVSQLLLPRPPSA